MKRRLELARAIIHSPSLLVLDEPTSGLDVHAFERTWRLIGALKRDQNLTVLASTHGEAEAAKCDKLVVLDNGRVVAFDTPQALLKRVSGDILVIETARPDSFAADLAQAFEVTPRVSGRKVLIEAAEAHTMVPRIRASSLSMASPKMSISITKRPRSLGELSKCRGGPLLT
jgi:ABC-2 type transport system ATP-binding protein